jgi:PKHD-type hydroxylase
MPKVNKYNVFLRQWTIWEKAFTPDEVNEIIKLEKNLEFSKGQVGEGEITKHRDSDVSWLHFNEDSQWVFNKFSKIVSRVNYEHFMYDIDSYESFQYTKYLPNQYYHWHTDAHPDYTNMQRKLSAVIMLSNPSEYVEGNLELIHDGNPDNSLKLKLNQGDIVFFASWMPHRVLPVLSGIRKTLVCWIEGQRSC